MTKYRKDRKRLDCSVCGLTKPSSQFYKGVTGRCRECHKNGARENRRNNPIYLEYDTKRSKTKKRKELSRKIVSRWRKINKDKYLASVAVNNAVRDGKLKKKPCLFCGKLKVHGHHSDYTKPLVVIWLCAKCHHRLHANFPNA